jgi:molybdopterin converting factor small subunit
MIRVKCVGHIRTSVGAETVELQETEISATGLMERMRDMARSDPKLGFTKFNTLIIVNGGQAFTAAAEDRKLKDGDEVLLLPFSHGG